MLKKVTLVTKSGELLPAFINFDNILAFGSTEPFRTDGKPIPEVAKTQVTTQNGVLLVAEDSTELAELLPGCIKVTALSRDGIENDNYVNVSKIQAIILDDNEAVLDFDDGKTSWRLASFDESNVEAMMQKVAE